MSRIIEIGDKPLRDITQEDLIGLVMLQGCCPSLEYYNEPIVTDLNNTMFSDSVVIDFHSFRKEDNHKSSIFTYFFNHKSLSFHYTSTRDNEKSIDRSGRNLNIEALSYLIEKGYNVPL